jgi:hypothetical protein
MVWCLCVSCLYDVLWPFDDVLEGGQGGVHTRRLPARQLQRRPDQRHTRTIEYRYRHPQPRRPYGIRPEVEMRVVVMSLAMFWQLRCR